MRREGGGGGGGNVWGISQCPGLAGSVEALLSESNPGCHARRSGVGGVGVWVCVCVVGGGGRTCVMRGRSSKQGLQMHLDSMPQEPSLPWGE